MSLLITKKPLYTQRFLTWWTTSPNPYSFLNILFIEIGQRITAWEIVVRIPLFVYKRISLWAKTPRTGCYGRSGATKVVR